MRPEDLGRAVTLDGPQEPRPGRSYAIGVDVGLVHDRTVVAAVTRERVDGVRRGRARPDARPQGSAPRPVKLDDVERLVAETARLYARPGARRSVAGGRAVSTAPCARAARLGVRVHGAERRPDREHVALAAARPLARPSRRRRPAGRTRETCGCARRSGRRRMDHDAGQHDDRAVALGLAAVALTETTETHVVLTRPTRQLPTGDPPWLTFGDGSLWPFMRGGRSIQEQIGGPR